MFVSRLATLNTLSDTIDAIGADKYLRVGAANLGYLSLFPAQ